MLRQSPEFEIISQYFSKHIKNTALELGVGDDGAVFKVPEGANLVFSIDTLVEGRHFPKGFPAYFIAQRALGSALSDLAAMGADPSHFTLALTLPEISADWLNDFSQGLFSYADRCNVVLAGGDMTRGPLTISVQVHGYVPAGQELRRSGAQSGDYLFLTGNVGNAAGGLSLALNQPSFEFEGDVSVEGSADQLLFKAFACPELRFDLMASLRGLASAAIDVSDGLLADTEQLVQASGVSAVIDVDKLPISNALIDSFGSEEATLKALSGGDDYVLLVSVPKDQNETALKMGLTHVGVLTARGDKAVYLKKNGSAFMSPVNGGYDHFVG